MLNRTIKALYHFTVYSVGIIVLLAAVTVTMLRLLLPDIGQYRGEIEAWGSRYMGFPVVIHSMDASWQGWIPNLNLSDIELLNKAGTESITHFESAQVKIDPIATLLRRQFVPTHLVVSGFELSVTRQNNGAITIQGINIENNEKNTDKNELAEWLFKQNKIELQNANIEWLDHKHEQAPLLLTDVDFTLRTDSERVQLEGSANLPSRYGKRMNFAFDAYGDLLSSEWSGELYLSAKGINPDSWYKNYRPLDMNIAGGNADIQVWSTWENAKLALLEGELTYNDFAALAKNTSLHVEELSYHFKGQRSNDDWRFHVSLDKLVTENGAWPKTEIFIATRANQEDETFSFDANFNFLKLDDLMPLVANLSTIPEQTKDYLAALSLSGRLNSGRISFNPQNSDEQKLLYDVGFSELTANLGSRLPAFSNLSGQMRGNLMGGVLSLSDHDSSELDFPAFYDETLVFSSLDGDLSWKYDDTGWQVNTQSVQVKTNNLSMRFSGRVWVNKDTTSPFVDLRAELDKIPLEKVASYFPQTDKLKIKEWLKKAVLGGQLNSASVVFRGHPKDFPFNSQAGQFKALANISDGVLEYSQQWPLVDNLDVEVLFSGNEMLGKFHRGKIFNADVTKATAYIADIRAKEKSIKIDGHINGQTRDTRLFVQQSPLKKNPMLEQVSRVFTAGGVFLDLKLDIPLKRGKKNIDIIGNIGLNDATIKSDVKDLKLQEVQGELQFTKNTTNSKNLTAKFEGQDVKLSVSRTPERADKLATISIQGHSNQDFVVKQIIKHTPALSSRKTWLSERLSGEIDWFFNLNYEKGETENEIAQSFSIESDLVGLAIDMPKPVGKVKDNAISFKLHKKLGNKTNSTLILNYGDSLTSNFLFDSPAHLKNIQIHFGETRPENTFDEPGLLLSGKFADFVFSEWWDALEFNKNKSQNKSFLSENNIYIDIETDVLSIFGQEFSNVRIEGLKSSELWNFSLNAEDVAGNISVPTKWERSNLLSLELDTLHLTKNHDIDSDKKPLDPRLIPSLAIKVKDFSYNDKTFGETLLSASPVDDGLSIDEFSFMKPSLKIHGEGSWKQKEQRHDSNFNIELNADSMDAMLDTFGYDVTAIKKGETNLLIDANWSGSPTDFSLDKLNGTLSMQIKRGQLLEVNPSAGRLFGLLSIQTLPRRLSLDFTDLFNKGLAFDSIEGSFEITNGNAYTNDLFMNGPSASVAVTGRTGLSVQDYDQVVTVTPQITGNLPVAGAIFGPVGIGLGAVIYFASQLFESTNAGFNKLLRYQYTITGDWNEPVIEKFKADTKENTKS